MTNNKQQTEINAVEYISKVNQFAKENNTDKPRQQTAVEWLLNAIENKNGVEFSSYYTEFIEQAKEMEKEQRAVEIQKFIDKVNEKIDRELGWCGGPRNKSFEMENWRKAYANVRKWMQNLNKEFQQTYGGGEQ